MGKHSSKLKEIIKSPHIQIALATGLSIVVMAYFSKRVLPQPIGYLPMTIPPFIALIYENVLNKHKKKKIATAWYWVIAIFAVTALIIILHSF
jgi:predicted histidine transporter YuiF (NhaC family)